MYPYQNYSVKDGLISSTIYSMDQDSIGYMWFATENGLSRFNGINFENNSLSQLGVTSYLSAIYASPSGDLFFGCGINGIFKFDPISFQIKQINKSNISQCNQLIIQDDFLISLHEYHNFDFLKLSDGVAFATDSIYLKKPGNKALSMKKLSDHRILLGRSDGLYEFVNGLQVKLNIQGFDNKPVYSIYEAPEGTIYLGSDGTIYKLKNLLIYDSVKVVTGEELRVRNILIDNNNALWFNVWGTKDIYMVTNNVVVNISERLTLKNASVTHMMLDKSGNIWVGMSGKGVFLFANMYLLNYSTSDDLPASNIKKIIKSENGSLLLGTNDGIAILHPTTKSISSVKNMPEMTQFVRAITAVGNNQYVIAITDIRLENPFQKMFTVANANFKIRYSHGSSLWSDSTTLWVGNWDNSISQYHLPDYKLIRKLDSVFVGLSNKLRINTIFKDKYHRFWIGSQQGFCVLNRSDEILNFDEMLNKNEITSITETTADRIVIVSNKGVTIFKNNPSLSKIKLLKNIDIENTTCVSLIDENEFLVGTKNGLYLVKADSNIVLTIHDGILSDCINDIQYEASQKKAYIATTEGLMELDLEKLKSTLIANYKIDDLIVTTADTLFHPGSEIIFSYKQNSFAIKFHTFNYSNPIKVNYQYRLDEGIGFQRLQEKFNLLHWNRDP
ncbi:MAG: hypothetical protein IPP71_04690 [Bacteroidetes bacterium]|nr:hypothetical protein [Bacteroidota bacterium]